MDKKILLSNAGIAKALKVSSKTLSNWVKLGMPQEARGKYDVILCFHWLIEKNAAEFENRLQGTDQKADEARIARSKANMLELDEAERQGKLIKADDVKDEWQNISSNVKTKLLAIPSKLSTRLVGKDSIIEIQEILQESITSTLNELHSRYAADNRNKKVIRSGTKAPAKAKNKPVGRRLSKTKQ